jgi:hypothetical protein
MDKSLNPGKNEKPEARLNRITPSGLKKGLPEASSGRRLKMLSLLSSGQRAASLPHHEQSDQVGLLQRFSSIEDPIIPSFQRVHDFSMRRTDQ